MNKTKIKQYLNRGISTPMAIMIILAIAIVTGGVVWYLETNMAKESIPTPLPSESSSPLPTSAPIVPESPISYIEVFPHGENDLENILIEGQSYEIKWKTSLDIKKIDILLQTIENDQGEKKFKTVQTIAKNISSDNSGGYGVNFGVYTWVPTKINGNCFYITIKTSSGDGLKVSTTTSKCVSLVNIEKNKTTGWKIYKSKEYGFEIQCPPTSILRLQSMPSSYHGHEFLGKAIISCEFPRPEYENTNLSIAYLSISVAQSEEDLSKCLGTLLSSPVSDGKKAGEKLTEQKKINGVTFYEDIYSSSGMQKSLTVISYRTIRQNNCFSIDKVFGTRNNLYDYSDQEWEIFRSNGRKLVDSIDQIISTFKFID